MQITLPFFAFTSLNSLPYVHHREKDNEFRFSEYSDCNEELNYLIPRVQEKTVAERTRDNDVSV